MLESGKDLEKGGILMKKQSMLPILLLVLALCATTAMAAPSINLGNDLSGSADQKKTFSDTLRVTNDGDDNLSISITISDLEYTGTSTTISKSAVSITPTSISKLEPGQSQDIAFSLTIPDDQELGTYEATITTTYNNGTETNTKTATLTLEVKAGNHLIIDRIDMTVDDEDQRMNDGDRHDEDAKPRSTVTFEIRVRNDFRDNIEIEDVEVEIYAKNDLDWDEQDDMSDLDRGDRDTITFTLDVPESDEIDDDTYDIEITVSGTDENGNNHGETWTVQLRVKRERYDLELSRISLSPSYLDCGENTVTITTTIENVGSRDVDAGTLIISSTAMKEDIIIRNIEVDEGDDITRTYTLPLKSNLQEGQYFVNLELFTSSNSNDDTDVGSTQLTVFACGQQTINEDEEEEESETEIEVITPTPTQPSTPTGNVVYKASGTPSTSFLGAGKTYIVLLIVIAVLLVILIGIAIAALTRK